MDLENLQQNLNTRVVFREPRGLIRWLQLFFALVAFSTVADFHTSVGIDITCPTSIAPSSNPQPANSTSSTSSTLSTEAASTNTAQASPLAAITQEPQKKHLELIVEYPFDFSKQSLVNNCPEHEYKYTNLASLNGGSPQFYLMTGVLSLIYASLSLVVYLCFSSTYESMPIWPVADLIVAGILCLFWFIGSSSFSSGVSLLKSTVLYDNLEQTLCPTAFKSLPGVQCVATPGVATWKSLNVSLLAGFTEFFLWAAGMWFVYKETHFHQPRNMPTGYVPR